LVVRERLSSPPPLPCRRTAAAALRMVLAAVGGVIESRAGTCWAASSGAASARSFMMACSPAAACSSLASSTGGYLSCRMWYPSALSSARASCSHTHLTAARGVLQAHRTLLQGGLAWAPSGQTQQAHRSQDLARDEGIHIAIVTKDSSCGAGCQAGRLGSCSGGLSGNNSALRSSGNTCFVF
jgi:hypothetical protein